MAIESVFFRGPGLVGERGLLVMLPGAHLPLSDFAGHGFVDALHQRWPTVDAIAVDLNPDDYLAGDAAGHLHDTVIGPEMALGYARLWLLGISLGGMGSLLYARAHPGTIDSVILLALFLATRVRSRRSSRRAGSIPGSQGHLPRRTSSADCSGG